jgi:hypothetical protein
MKKLFTAEEANALLPLMKHELELIRESLAVLRKASASLPPGARVDDGSAPVSAAALAQLQGAEKRLADMGVELKDVEQGLFDFPALRDERVVLLCWREGEPEVEWFHEIVEGFAGRQPLAGDGGETGLQRAEGQAED